MLARYTRRLESLLGIARSRPLTAREIQEFRKIERYLDPRAKATHHATSLLAEIRTFV